MEKPNDGPSLERYVETRFNLLIVATQEAQARVEARLVATEKSVDQRFAAADSAREEQRRAAVSRFDYLKETIAVGQEVAKRAVDKAEAQQVAINVAQNEWRGTLNDFNKTLVNRTEFDKLYSDFTAYRLEVARLLSANTAEKSAAREVRVDTSEREKTNMTQLAMVVGAVTAIVSIAVSVVLDMRNNKPAAPPQVVVVPAQPQPAPR